MKITGMLIKCWLCKERYANKKYIMYTVSCSDGKNHKICYHCKLLRIIGE